MYFEILKASNGQFYFVLKAANHRVVATSEMYLSKQSAIDTVSSIKSGVNIYTTVRDLT